MLEIKITIEEVEDGSDIDISSNAITTTEMELFFLACLTIFMDMIGEDPAIEFPETFLKAKFYPAVKQVHDQLIETHLHKPDNSMLN